MTGRGGTNIRGRNPRQSRSLLHLLRAALSISGLAALVLTLAGAIPFHGERIGWGFARDLYAYWAADLADPYSTPVGVGFAYLYSPAFLQFVAPLKLLPFEVLSAVWLLCALAALWWLRALWMLVIPGVSSDLLLGNINVFIAVAIVVSVRHPGAWALPLLTKVTPGIGVAWLPFRGEWRAFATAIALTASISAISFLLQPAVWCDWIALLGASADSRGHTTAQFAPLPLRVAVAGAMVGAAGVWRQPWLLSPAALIATPVIWPASLALLTAIPRLAPLSATAIAELPHPGRVGGRDRKKLHGPQGR